MTDHDKKISGVEAPLNPEQQQSAPSEGRRRLMKGALAAPAVMTLMHGRLAAAQSIYCNAPEKADMAEAGWFDFDGNELVLGSDASGNEVLGYYINNGEDFVPSAPYAPSHSCWTSLRTSPNV